MLISWWPVGGPAGNQLTICSFVATNSCEHLHSATLQASPRTIMLPLSLQFPKQLVDALTAPAQVPPLMIHPQAPPIPPTPTSRLKAREQSRALPEITDIPRLTTYTRRGFRGHLAYLTMSLAADPYPTTYTFGSMVPLDCSS